MPKLNLNTIGSRYASVAALNNNFDAIETAIDNTLSRDGTSPNQMEVDFDMNSNRIINLPEPTSPNDAARLADVTAAISGATAANLISYTPTGNIAASTVQGAINELDTEKLAASSVSAFMSTVLDDTTAANARTTLGAVGSTGDETIAGVKTFSSNPVITGGSVFRKNAIINGDMRIDQRNAGASVVLTSGGAVSFAADRFYGYYDTSAASVTNQQVTDVPANSGFINSYKWTTGTGGSATASQQARIVQRIEGINVADLMWGSANAKTITISFWVKSSLTGTFSCAVQNSASDRSYVATYSISATNTWEQKSITIAGDTTGTWLTTTSTGIGISWDLGSGTNRQTTANTWASGNYTRQSMQPTVIGNNGATFYITGIQLEVGSVATQFEHRPYVTELLLCQRYYQTQNALVRPYVANTDNFHWLEYRTQMRASATVTWTTTSSLLLTALGGPFNATNSGFEVSINCTDTGAGGGYALGTFTASAEL